MRREVRYGSELIGFEVTTNSILKDRIRIHVHPNCQVEVEAPPDTDEKELSAGVVKRGRWISKQLAQARSAKAHALPREYVSGETHFYIGRRYKLRVSETNEKPGTVTLKGGTIEVTLRTADKAAIRRRLSEWYFERANDYFERRMATVVSGFTWIEETPKFKLVTMKKQWGSCAPSGVIHLNPWLIRAPSDCIDYVIAHELCHLRERNHSPAYYKLLTRHCPDWQHRKAKLDGIAELILAE
ncbi:M48 family metallopeptidase [Parvularcula marina]|uniref:M48 family metallopeptidase n=1 Tax=Parvularcula marina TaxID=2292771 RepID=UPI0035160CF2